MLINIKKSKSSFLVFEKGIKESAIDLDFNPFVDKESLKKGLILHLRARPPINPCCWTYGIYDVAEDNYLSVDNVHITDHGYSVCITGLISKPSHVIIFPDSLIKIVPETNTGTIYKAKISTSNKS